MSGTMTDPLPGFIATQCSFTQQPITGDPPDFGGFAIYRFNPPKARAIPVGVRTGETSFGSPTELKRIDYIDFHGEGTLIVRVIVDKIWVIDGRVTMTENPSKTRRFCLPTGLSGYVINLEYYGVIELLRAIEISYRPARNPND